MAKDDRRSIVLVLVVVALIAIPTVFFISMEPQENGSGDGTVEADALGRRVNVTSHERMVSCAPDITEAIYTMGLGDKLIGVTDYCDFPQDVLDRKAAGTLKAIGGYWNPSLEEIIALQPDLVFISYGVQAHLAMVNQLEAMNITTVALYSGTDLAEVYTNIRIIGQAFSDEQKAEQVISDMTATLDKIGSITSMHTIKPKVLFAVWLDPLYTTGGETYIDEIINMAGGKNPFGQLTGWPQPSMEQVIDVKPDFLLVSGTMMLMTPEQIIESLQQDPIWSQTPAVQKGNIFVLTGQAENCFLRQGVRMVDAVHLLAEILFPSDFGADVPNVIGSEYQTYLEPLPDYTNSPMTVLAPMVVAKE